jgi:hypothetical protein
LEKLKTGSKNYTKLIFTVLIIIALVSLMIFSNVTVKMSETEIDIRCGMDHYTVLVEDITSVQTINSLAVGVRVMGADLITKYSGTFKNDAYGSYKLFIYKNSGSCIEITTTKGVVVLNQKTAEDTLSLYENIKALIGE